jgi:hypothetical protein
MWTAADFEGTYGLTVPNSVAREHDFILNSASRQPAPHALQTNDPAVIMDCYVTLLERISAGHEGVAPHSFNVDSTDNGQPAEPVLSRIQRLHPRYRR